MDRHSTSSTYSNRSAPKVDAQGVRLAVLACVLILLGSLYWLFQPSSVEELQEKYARAVANNEWELAEEAAKSWLKRQPNDADALLKMADALQAQEKWLEIVEVLENFPEADARFPRILIMRAELALGEVGNIPLAIATWQRLLEIDPLNSTARQRLTFIYSMTLQREQLKKLLRESVVLGCEPAESYFYLFAISNLNFSNGLIKTLEWLEVTPDNPDLQVAKAIFAAEASVSSTLSHFDLEDIRPGSPELVNNLLAKFPHSVELNAYKIKAGIAHGDLEIVSAAIERLEGFASNDCRIPRGRGWLLKQQNRFEEARIELMQAVALNLLDWKSRFELAEAQRILGEKEAARKNAELAARGKELEKTFMELPSATTATDNLMRQLLTYIEDCGDTTLATRLRERLRPPF